ncbi:uncharacterized protein LOC106151045 [Lingula anatina]|uniref:Uncharacterized protein LOC106151045 n=1 Tax=Lingula anatina TaxID=7574 RepID=A0A1S3H0C8_LINAN|nr:uncharacterized protein LOC106151045 [Lingula anatina]|eukprot:XP_013379575.1 uncharacterized protein LOC106151045 [Lingula anatina]
MWSNKSAVKTSVDCIRQNTIVVTMLAFTARGLIWVRIWLKNVLAHLCYKIFGLKLCPVSQDSILDSGHYINGKDTGWIEPFTLLIRSYRETDTVTAHGRQTFVDGMKFKLNVRAKVKRELSNKAELFASKIPVRKPVFVLGVMRSGTTFLHGLLAQDPAFRPPLLYELLDPVPPQTGAGTKDDPRIAMGTALTRAINIADPDFSVKHEIGAELPHECFHLLAAMRFIDKKEFLHGSNISAYQEWWKTALTGDYMTAVYREYRAVLQLMASKDEAPRPFLLKDHIHCLFMDSVLEVFPDASFIYLVRNPVDLVSSWCSVMESLATLSIKPGTISPRERGERALNDLSYFASTFVDFRKKCDASGTSLRCMDVLQSDLVKDPMKVVKDIYAFLGVPLTYEAEDKMALFMDERRKFRARAKHIHRPEDFGITKDMVLDKFQDYVEYFGLQI